MPDSKQVTLTKHQQYAFNKLMRFALNKNLTVFILKGYAGTGKTTMMKQFIGELRKREIRFQLLASTGRAAKILSNATCCEAKTVHSQIYTFQDLNQDLEKVEQQQKEKGVDESGNLFINFELTHADCEEETIYIVDESSMISDQRDNNTTQAVFGSGRLLADLMAYDPIGKFIFVGDACQLPPVSQPESPALSAQYFKDEFDIYPDQTELTEIIRQSAGNDIVVSAQKMRYLYQNPQPWKWAKFPFKGYRNIHVLDSHTELLRRYMADIRAHGYNYATILCDSNRQCQQLTEILRPAFGIASMELSHNDLLLVTQNNYISGLMNGDLMVVEGTGLKERRAGLTFQHVKVKELVTGKTYSQLLITDIVYQNQTNLSQAQQKELFLDYYYRMKSRDIKQKSKEFKDGMMTDPYLNALRAVYGYALTCHKAQGGEWEHVYLDIPRNFASKGKPFVYQWIYTAMTRAEKELYVVDDFWVM